MERGLTKAEIITIMGLSPHGDLSQYIPTFSKACGQDPEFAAHFIAYVANKSQVRDINNALPVISLSVKEFDDEELVDNSLAHLAQLDPRNLLTAFVFAELGKYSYSVKSRDKKGREVYVKAEGQNPQLVRNLARAHHRNTIAALVRKYLRAREEDQAWFVKTVLNFGKKTLVQLYQLSDTRPCSYAWDILYKGFRPKGSSLEAVRDLPRMSTLEAAAAIVKHSLPTNTLLTVLGEKAKTPTLLSAIIDRMTPTQLQTNLKNLEKMGVNDFPETRAALELSLQKLATSKKTTLKTTRALESGAIKSEKTRERLKAVQEKQIDQSLNIEGDWGVLVDRSGSMREAIEAANHLGAFLARVAKGKVHICYFDTDVRYIEATGKTYEQLKHETRLISAGGSTSIGCGLQYLVNKRLDVDGLAIISDGGENATPYFRDVYSRYCNSSGKDIPVYLYLTSGNGEPFVSGMRGAGHALDVFDVRGGFDYYSLPNVAISMRTNRFGLHDDIMSTRLLTVDSILGINKPGGQHAKAVKDSL